MRLPILIAGLGVFAATVSCAPTTGGESGSAPPQARACFNTQTVTNFRRGRPDQIFLRVGRNDVYELQAAGGCREVDFAIRLAIVPERTGAAGTRICTNDWVRIFVPGPNRSPTAFCRARVSRLLTPEEVAALPAAHTP
ncbi:hypothetical protein [Brevundimonas lenta]|uniref:Lipoprotein n=1 Tax=Brevundimonas lenta TaxID=424796 RepID=A0A7W6J9V1_9CAUL|nr:hypothetical protein [Brevundimonas lenta]MBB4081205.1 hypothetical protein [Brevundimonas lenta]